MSKFNVLRLVLGGFGAGAVIFILTGIVNGVILRGELQEWQQGMGGLIHPPARSVSMGLWTSMSFIYGIVGIWIYAGMQPRYGAGPMTALLAGFALWVVSKLTVALDFTALGLVPGRIVAGQTLGALVAIMLGILAGAWLYKE